MNISLSAIVGLVNNLCLYISDKRQLNSKTEVIIFIKALTKLTFTDVLSERILILFLYNYSEMCFCQIIKLFC